MEIAFADHDLAKMCSTEAGLIEYFGEELAARAGIILIALKCAESLADVPTTPPENRKLVMADGLLHFTVDVAQNIQICFRATDHNDEDRGCDEGLAGVKAIEIQQIEGADQ